MGRSNVFSLEQIYRKQVTQTWSKIPEVFRYVTIGGGGPDTGYWASGYDNNPTSIVDRLDFTNDTATAVAKGSLSRTAYNVGAIGNSSYGYIGGGGNPEVSTVDRIDYSSDTGTTPAKGPLSLARRGAKAVGDLSYGYWAGGGEPTGYSTVDRLDYSNDTAAAVAKTTLSTPARWRVGSVSNLSYGYIAGGAEPSAVSTVDRLDFSNDTATMVAKAPLSIARTYVAGAGNSSYGYFMGGVSPNASTVDRLDYTNDTASMVPRGPLSQPGNNANYRAGTGNSDYGYAGGGTGSSPNLSSMDRLDFNNDTSTAVTKGPLSHARYNLDGISSRANALPSPSYQQATRTESGGTTPVGTDFGYVNGSNWTISPSYSSTIDRIDYSNDTATALVRGPLSTENHRAGGNSSNVSYGYISGNSPATNSIIDRIDFNNDTATSTPKGNLGVNAKFSSGTGNNDYGYHEGNDGNISTNIRRIDYSNDTAVAALKGNFEFQQFARAAAGNQSYGYFTATTLSNIERIDYANDDTTAAPKGPMSDITRYGSSAVGSPAYVYFAGGFPGVSTVNRLDSSNDSATTLVKGPLSTVAKQIGATGSASYGYITAGERLSPTSTVDRIDYANDTATASPKGPTSAAYGYNRGFSSRMNALPTTLTPTVTVDKGADGYISQSTSGNSTYPYGYIVGGEPAGSSVDRIDYGNDTATASPKGNLSVERNSIYNHGLASPSKGYVMGGYTPSVPEPNGNLSSIDRIDLSNDTATAPAVANLNFTPGLYGGGAVGNGDYGYLGGGGKHPGGSYSTIRRFDYSSDTTNTVDKSTLHGAKMFHTAVGNLSYGYFAGYASDTQIDRLDFSNDTAATTPKGNTVIDWRLRASTGNQSYGYLSGGQNPSPAIPDGYNDSRIERIDYSNDTANVSPKGPMAAARYGHAATGSGRYGYQAGGRIGSSPGSTSDRLDFANDTDASSPKGNMTRTMRFSAGLSSQEDGKQSFTSGFIPRIRWVDSVAEVPPSSLAPAFGYFHGGEPGYTKTRVDRIDFSNDTDTLTARGPLSTGRSWTGVASNKDYGYWAGGYDVNIWPRNMSSVDRIDYSNDSATTSPKGPISLARYFLGGTGNASYGYFGGGYGPSTDVSNVDRIDYSNDTPTASPKGALDYAPAGIQKQGVTGNQSFGYFASGDSYVTKVTRIDYSNDTATSTPKGPITTARQSIAATGNASFGYFAGGTNPSTPNNTTYVDRIDYSNDTATGPAVGSLSLGQNSAGATGSPAFGYVGGGDTGGESNIDRIDYSNDTATALSRTTLGSTNKDNRAVSGRENGLLPVQALLAPVQPPFPYPVQLPVQVNVNDVFDAFLYTGNGLATSSNRAIDVGIDFATNGGMVWIKNRSEIMDHVMQDTVRGAGSTKRLASNSSEKENHGVNSSGGGHISSFTSTGFELNNGGSTSNLGVNSNADNFVAWCFRKAAGFFDIQTWTGNGTAGRTISHNLDSVPGAIWIKSTSTSENWVCYHRQTDATSPENYYLSLNATTDKSDATVFNDTAPTSTEFTLGSDTKVNENGTEYVAYIFAHNDARFGDNYDKAIIYCGGYTGSSAPNTVTIGWKPQFLIFKNPNNNSMNWRMYDDARGIPTGVEPRLMPNLTNAEETTYDKLDITSTGFVLNLNNNDMNQPAVLHTYIAIRILD